MTPLLIDLCLACLDQASAWIDQMQITGEIPADADAKADDLVRRFSSLGASDESRSCRSAIAGSAAGAGLSAVARQLLGRRSCFLRSRRRRAPRDGWIGRQGRGERAPPPGRSLDATDLEGLLQSSLLAGDAKSMAAAIDRILEGLTEPAPAPPGTLAAQPPDVTLRVDVERIDTLVRLTGELLIAKNAIGHSAGLAQDAADPRRWRSRSRTSICCWNAWLANCSAPCSSARPAASSCLQRFPRLVRRWRPPSPSPRA